MKGTLEFNLPEESTEHQDAIDGWKWKAIIRDLYNDILRPYWKYGDDEQKAEFAEEIWERVNRKIEEYRLDLND